MYVNAGELDKRIDIYRKPPLGGDGYEEEDARPKLVRSCWAKFTQVSGRELFQANADVGEARARFLIRYAAIPIDRKMFVRYRGNDYEILYINGYGDSLEYLELWCKWESEGVLHEAEAAG